MLKQKKKSKLKTIKTPRVNNLDNRLWQQRTDLCRCLLMAVRYRALQMFTKVNSKLAYRRQALLVYLNHPESTKLSSNTLPIPPSTAFMSNVLILPVTTLTNKIQNYLFGSFYRNKINSTSNLD